MTLIDTTGKPTTANIPQILLLAGLDPSGGAGLQADIQTCTAFGCHALPVMTVNTIQDTGNIYGFKPEAPEWIRRQLETLLKDMTPCMVKIGALGSSSVAIAICQALANTDIPIIYDPVLSAGGGGALSDREMLEQIMHSLLPTTFLCTPNIIELLEMTGVQNESAAIEHLTNIGCQNILVTGGHDTTSSYSNRLYSDGQLTLCWPWQRTPGEYRGTGCTLSTAIAALLATNHSLPDSCQKAGTYISTAVQHAYAIGAHQQIPRRFPLNFFSDTDL